MSVVCFAFIAQRSQRPATRRLCWRDIRLISEHTYQPASATSVEMHVSHCQLIATTGFFRFLLRTYPGISDCGRVFYSRKPCLFPREGRP